MKIEEVQEMVSKALKKETKVPSRVQKLMLEVVYTAYEIGVEEHTIPQKSEQEMIEEYLKDNEPNIYEPTDKEDYITGSKIRVY